MNIDYFLNQLFQPYFYYSMILVMISFICISVLMRLNFLLSPFYKSIAYLIPLVIPVVVTLVFFPMTTVRVDLMPQIDKNALFHGNYGSGYGFPPQFADFVSITGILCLSGLFVALLFAALMTLSNDRIARKVLHIIEIEPNEYSELQERINNFSKMMHIARPKIGLVDDLRPNAFTIGYGQKTTIVFSAGLLKSLTNEEISAVAFHELAHVKNHDFLFKLVSSSLVALSFFNPFAYIASSAAQREREILADSKAAKLLDKPNILGTAILKISASLMSMQNEGLTARLTSNLFVTSSFEHRLPKTLSSRPRVSERLRNISSSSHRQRPPKVKIASTFALSLLIIAASLIACYSMIGLPSAYSNTFHTDASINNFSVNSTFHLPDKDLSAFEGNYNMNPQSETKNTSPSFSAYDDANNIVFNK